MFIARASRSPSALRFLAAGLAAVLVLVGGVAEAAHRYDEGRADTLLPGITIGGFEVGGMPVDEARALLARHFETPLEAPLTIRVGDRSTTTSFRELGATTNASEQLRAARRFQDDLGFPSRLYHRVTGNPVERNFSVERRLDREEASTALDAIAADVEIAPVNSTVDTSSGFVETTPSREGRAIAREKALGILEGALERGTASLALPTEPVPPEVTEDDHGTILLVRTGENKLYRYENDRLVKTYPVATGQARYPTPTGHFHVTLKRGSPVWINPAPNGWGAGMPRRRGPCASCPLGLRALNINAPGIRIHGTSATSSIGYNASHGCVRMTNTSVIELFDQVNVGDPVYIVEAGPPRPPGSGLPEDYPSAVGA